MNPNDFWVATICICGAAQCIFLACCFGVPRSGNQATQSLPALLMLLLGMRILKSVYYIVAGADMPVWIMNLGFAAHLAAAIVLYQYFRSLSKHRIDRNHLGSWHFLPVVLLTLASPWLTLDAFWYLGGYHLLLAASIAYWLAALQIFCRQHGEDRDPQPARQQWSIALLAGTGIFFFAYFSNYALGLIPYEIASAVYSLAVFPLGFVAWYNFDYLFSAKLPGQVKKYQNLSLTNSAVLEGKKAIMKILEEEQAYLEPEFSLHQLSERTKIPTHLLSHILNQHLDINFTTLINRYRIEAACQLLRRSDRGHYTIAAIAFEVGFNSLSAFNYHFKRFKGTTPSIYRKRGHFD